MCTPHTSYLTYERKVPQPSSISCYTNYKRVSFDHNPCYRFGQDRERFEFYFHMLYQCYCVCLFVCGSFILTCNNRACERKTQKNTNYSLKHTAILSP
eukprot:sb/3478893/